MKLSLTTASIALAAFAAVTLGCSGQGDSASVVTPPADSATPAPSATDSAPTPPADPMANATPIDALVFAVVGDTRPPTPNDIGGYPTAIITAIYADIAKRAPAFVVGTGDYQFASTYGDMAGQQMDLYLAARAQYKGAFYPVMGNHECTGGTASNCGAQGKDGATANYTAFLTKMVQPIGESLPYYVKRFKGADGSWTAKFVFVAANAWSDAQATWLGKTMAEPSTYTFVVHHEPAYETQAPGIGPMAAILAKHPYTLGICGHSHTYRRPWANGGREVIVGNGGAPATGGVNYGYGLFARAADGTIQADMIDYQTAQPTPSLAFSVKADGVVQN